MAVEGTIFGFYGTKSLRKNYNIGKKCIINIGFKVSSKNEKMAKKIKNGKIEFFGIFPFFEKTLKRIVIIPFLPVL